MLSRLQNSLWLRDLRALRKEVDWTSTGVLLFAAVCLTLKYYLGGSGWSQGRIPEPYTRSLEWVGAIAFAYALLPMAYAPLVLKTRLRDLGLAKLTGLRSLLPYALLYAALFPLLLLASRNEGFRSYYPIYAYAGESVKGFVIWEIAYAGLFFCVEFFFRGFLLFGLEKRLGLTAIAISVVPYCMVHFNKPLAEVLGAILAGSVLGYLALKTRSIWGGVVLHTAVAWTMDILVIVQKL